MVLIVRIALKYPIVIGIPDPLSCVTFSKAQDSGFHKQNIPDSFAASLRSQG